MGLTDKLRLTLQFGSKARERDREATKERRAALRRGLADWGVVAPLDASLDVLETQWEAESTKIRVYRGGVEISISATEARLG